MNIMELLVENPQEDCGDEDIVVVPRSLTLKCMSPAFSHVEEGLDMLAEGDLKRKYNSKMHWNVMKSV
jgi:hypothetical protein